MYSMCVHCLLYSTANQIVSNLFSNFQSPPQGEQQITKYNNNYYSASLAGPGANVVVQMLFMQGKLVAM